MFGSLWHVERGLVANLEILNLMKIQFSKKYLASWRLASTAVMQFLLLSVFKLIALNVFTNFYSDVIC